MEQNVSKDFITLVCMGVGHDTLPLSNNVNWIQMQALAKRHGLLGILVDGVEKLPSYLRPPLTTWLQWIGEVMQGYEQRYEKYREAVSGLVSFYNGHGYQKMILKQKNLLKQNTIRLFRCVPY